MNLDRLVHRIEKTLREGAPDPVLLELATEYARYRAIIKGRLDKCMVLIGSKQDFTALEVAEQSPPLFTLMEKLSFAKEGKWKQLCEEKGLDPGPDWEDEQVAQLEKLYSKKMSEDSPIFREYRDAARSRDDERTFRILKKLIKEHPGHPAAKRQYLQLSRKMLSVKIDALDSLVREGREQEFLALMREIETTDWVVEPMGAKWEKALATRKSLKGQSSLVGDLANPVKGSGAAVSRFVRYLRGLDLIPKGLILVAAVGTAWLKGGFPWASAVTLVIYWALFGFRRNAR